MRRTDNGADPRTGPAYQPPPDETLPSLSQYERLIDDGIAAADVHGRAVDHVTARRLAIWLAARPQPPAFARALLRFVSTGAISHDLKTQLRLHSRSGNYPDHPEAGRLMQYCTARGTSMGPVGENFAAACDLLDRADLMLTGQPIQAQPGPARPGQAWPETDGPPALALARRDPASHTVILVLDAATASTAIFAITAHADEREAHIREVRQFGQALPEGSYGQRNRQAIAARETRIAARLRAVQHAYQAAIDRDPTPTPPEPTEAGRPADREIELE